MVDYLETELAVERTLAQGRAAREANIALALQRSVNGLAATTCDLMRAAVLAARPVHYSLCCPAYRHPCHYCLGQWQSEVVTRLNLPDA